MSTINTDWSATHNELSASDSSILYPGITDWDIGESSTLGNLHSPQSLIYPYSYVKVSTEVAVSRGKLVNDRKLGLETVVVVNQQKKGLHRPISMWEPTIMTTVIWRGMGYGDEQWLSQGQASSSIVHQLKGVCKRQLR